MTTPTINRASKRALDLVVVGLAAPILGPIAVIAGVAHSLESPGSILFRQVRVGQHGRRFSVYKLRTMVEDAENIGAGLYNEANDPRFTTIGKLLRRLSLDEVPQLLNVLLGDMSAVGPRPMIPMVVDEYAEEYKKILEVKPGLTGLAQVSGRNSLPRRERLALDMEYAATWSILTDLRILLRTISVVLTGDGQRNDQSRADVEQ